MLKKILKGFESKLITDYDVYKYENAIAISRKYQRKRFLRIIKWFVKDEKFLLTGIYEYADKCMYLQKREIIKAEIGVITKIISEKEW